MTDGWYEICFGEGLDRLTQGIVAGLISSRVWGGEVRYTLHLMAGTGVSIGLYIP